MPNCICTVYLESINRAEREIHKQVNKQLSVQALILKYRIHKQIEGKGKPLDRQREKDV